MGDGRRDCLSRPAPPPAVRRRAAALLVCAALAAAPLPALAADASATDPYERGMALLSDGDYLAAIEHFDRAIGLHSPATPARLRPLVQALYARASAYSRLGRYAQAQAGFEAVLGLTSVDAVPDLRREALFGLAHIDARTGRYALAAEHFDAGMALLSGADDAAARADAQYAFAVTLAMSGDHEHAAEVAEALLEAELALPVPRPWDLALIRLLLATELTETGRPEAAPALFEQVSADLDQRLPAGHHLHALVAVNHGNALLALERLPAARAQYQRALALHPDNGAPERVFPLAGLGTVALWQNDTASARRYFDSIVPAIEAALGEHSGSAQFVRTGQAAALWADGEIDAAFELAVANERRRQALLAGVVPAFAERQALALKEWLQPDYEWVVAMAARAPNPERVELAWSLLMAARGEVTATVAHRRASARAGADPALEELWQAWRRSNQALAEAVVADLAQPGNDELPALREAADRAERALARTVAALARARAEQGAGIDAVAQALPPRSALVALVYLRHGEPAAFDRSLRPQRFARRVAFVLEPGRAPRLVDLGPAAPVEASARAWHRALRDPAMAVQRVDRLGTDVRRRVLEPLALAPDLTRLFVLADGALARVNLAALPDPAGGYLVEHGPAVHHLEHELDLVGVGPDDGAPARLLLVGLPGDGATVQRDSGCAQGFAPLPHVARELDGIQRLWSEQGDGRASRRLQGDQAGREQVVAALPGGGVLHFATHALAFEAGCRPDQRAVAISDDADGDEALPALVLAGQAGAGVGLLTADEIAAMDLAGTQWAVLSACETGLGVEQSGEGVFGLRRAFRIAGARTVIMSLWPVQDAATADWMQRLYGARLGAGDSTLAAVAQAQRGLLAARRTGGQSVHPYYWASFIAAGAWR
jgi:CHAT domain-containing protein/tetratricopeptide (TPR) repeat protein